MLRLLPLLHVPISEYVLFDYYDYAFINSDNILNDLTISYEGIRYNVLMEEVASIMNIPETLRNVKVFHHQGTKHFRMMKQGSSRKTVRGAKKVSKQQGKKRLVH